MTRSAESDAHCLRCGLRLSMTHEFCFVSHDGSHRPTLTSVTPPEEHDHGWRYFASASGVSDVIEKCDGCGDFRVIPPEEGVPSEDG